MTFGRAHYASKQSLYFRMAAYYAEFGNVKVHRAVCEAFHGPAPEGKPYVLHKDGDAVNNLPSNLEWGTQKENLNHPVYLALRAEMSSGPIIGA